MCYQYPFAVLPVVVPAPESHRSVSIPLGMLVSLSESHGILRRGIISPQDGYSIVKVQVPSLVWTGEGALGGVLRKEFSLHLFPLGDTFCSGAFQRFLRENEKATHRLGAWLKLPDRQKSDFISENHQIRLKIGENSAIIFLSFYIL